MLTMSVSTLAWGQGEASAVELGKFAFPQADRPLASGYFPTPVASCFYFLICKLWIMHISYRGGVGWGQRELQARSS